MLTILANINLIKYVWPFDDNRHQNTKYGNFFFRIVVQSPIPTSNFLDSCRIHAKDHWSWSSKTRCQHLTKTLEAVFSFYFSCICTQSAGPLFYILTPICFNELQELLMVVLLLVWPLKVEHEDACIDTDLITLPLSRLKCHGALFKPATDVIVYYQRITASRSPCCLFK